jgi:uncharacterized protein YxeA
MITAKKGQGLSMNTIIIAILAILVLVVIAVIFSSKIRDGNTNMRLCESKGAGAHCAIKCEAHEVQVGDSSDTSCQGDETKCCLPMYDT